jgi:hypothetical protein
MDPVASIVGRRFSDVIPTGTTKGRTKYQVLKSAAKSFKIKGQS